ncbi:ABC transporter ATP-binding protein [Glutamicibacter protophormiae]|uniref:ABC transporter ATP-binding protein n=1 Tax=Kocuria TaxID=57493 RepID=UPI000A62D4E8|nr:MULTISPECIES: ABC transporter ATP-binding protein [Kocuria]MDN5631219.1 ABC transporter ATP-binding protein [Kocuria sp.]WNB89693.1 ABC transporter ATP-binding protein [Glutamicibacter protophormiae]
MRTNAEDGPVEDFRDDGALGSLFGADGDLSFLDEKERGAATGPAVVIDHVSMVYNVTSTGGGDEVAVPAPVRWARKALGRPPVVRNRAVNDLTLAMHQGEFVGFIGRNGSGKSTLMNIVAGQMNPTSGRVYAVDTPVKLGVNVSLVPALSGEKNIRLGCLAQGMDPRHVQEILPELVEIAALGNAIHWPMKAYSSGMAARLRFAVATATDPHILILDEALSTGDAQFRERGQARMAQIREQAGCVLFVSHTMTEVREMCSRVVWLDQGDLLMDGDPDDVTREYEAFMKQLAAGNNLAAEREKERLMSQVVRTELREVHA